MSDAKKKNSTAIIVPGSLNTDLIGKEVERIIGPGELTIGKEFSVGAGGKSRNIAEMIARVAGRGKVVMLGRTTKDSYGLWKLPFNALKKAGVNISCIKFSNNGFPGIALIPVDKEGKNQIYVLPGVNAEFSPKDIKDATKVFKEAGANSGVMAMSMELPKETALAAIRMANENGLKVILDPGGIAENTDNGWIAEQNVFILKPNEHEAKILTEVEIIDFQSAKKAAMQLLSCNIKNVLITAGKNGAYLFNEKTAEYLPVPKIQSSNIFDETGCGDQATAVLAASIWQGMDIQEASKLAVLAGTMQFYRQGISPVTKEELQHINK